MSSTEKKQIEYFVEIVKRYSHEVVKRIACPNERQAERVERGVQINLSPNYYTRIVDGTVDCNRSPPLAKQKPSRLKKAKIAFRMTFDDFRATGRDVPDIGAVLADGSLEGVPGRIYLDALFIEDDRRGETGKWYTYIGNVEYLNDDLKPIEQALFEYAASEGYCTPEEVPNSAIVAAAKRKYKDCEHADRDDIDISEDDDVAAADGGWWVKAFVWVAADDLQHYTG